ncbi:MAG: squalene--hopene cyclase, partial [Frankia sp.]
MSISADPSSMRRGTGSSPDPDERVTPDNRPITDQNDQYHLRDRVATATARATDHLLALQSDEGWWKGELQTNVTMDAEDLMLRRFFGILTEEQASASARWIRSQQQPDGTWATFHGGPSDLSTTAEAYVALKIAGDDPAAPHMAAARDFVRARGGLARTRVFTRMWLALFGEWSWDDLPVMPPEMVLLPEWFPLNIYDFGCWARQTIVPLTIVGTLRPVRPLGVSVAELRVDSDPASRAGGAAGLVRSSTLAKLSWAGAFTALDRALHAYHRRPLRPLRELALRRGAEWIVARQEADGGWGGIQPPWVYSIMALHLLGYPMDHPVIVAGFAGLERFTVHEDSPDGPMRRLEACQSPVWDTALAVVALADAGVSGDHPALVKAASWMLAEEVDVPGDWAVRRPGLPPAGWAFEFDNDLYPDVDDTAEVVLALRRVGESTTDARLAARIGAAVERGVAWTIGMRSASGAWAAFDADNTSVLPTKLPFCDFGEVIDPPSAEVTAHVVEMLADLGRAGDGVTRGGVTWLLDQQEPGGSWFGRWGVNYIYGTTLVL